MPLHSTPSRAAPRPLLALLLVLFAGGCKVGPDFRPPQPQLPQAWFGPTVKPSPAEAAAQDLTRWWTVFNDPTLTSLVDRAVHSNLTVKQAESRIRQARAARQMTASGLGPSLAGVGSFSRSRSAGSGFVVSQVNLNDGSVEGLRHATLPIETVQYHPEGAPGPLDALEVFDRFVAAAREHARRA